MRHKASVAKKVNELTRSNKCAEMERKNLEACLQQINDVIVLNSKLSF